jgi:hypothetical protein
MTDSSASQSPPSFRAGRAVADALNLVGRRIGFVLWRTWPAALALYAADEALAWLRDDLPAILPELANLLVDTGAKCFVAVYIQ